MVHTRRGEESASTPATERTTRRAHLEHPDGDAQRDSGAPQRPLVVGDAPRIPLELLEDAGELELALLDGHEEPRRSEGGRRHGLAGTRNGSVRRVEAKHVLDLLGSVLLGSSEDVRLGAL